ncbi:hypothetical protein N5C56_24335 [Pseudomonas chengduensis]|nr:hypothetical protein [Pseudomonas chengduensis]MDH1283774.1 hypothetical protein [Pseudomonas chengduensis]
MIDDLDKETQPLQLETKRGRGRPATGQALSNAERQRKYREAQKAQRNENMHKEVAEDLRAELEKALEEVENLREMARAEFKRAEGLQGQAVDMGLKIAQLEYEVKKLKKTKAGPTKSRYVLQWQDSEKGDWHDDKTGDYGSKAMADAACKAMNKDGFSKMLWRVRERQWV